MVSIGAHEVMGAADKLAPALSHAPDCGTDAVAVASNVLFIAYGGMGPPYPLPSCMPSCCR